MAKWQYCRVNYLVVRDANGMTDETLEIHMPDGSVRTEKGTGNGMVMVLNELGADGWEVFDLGPQSTWLKRHARDNAGTA